MSNYYLNTDKVEVYPSTRRANHQISARLLSESSMVALINKLIDTDGFVITPDDENSEYGIVDFTKPFEFNIHGYYFIADSGNDIINMFSNPAEDDKIYANIFLDTNGNYVELKGQDVDNSGTWTYHGVTFSDSDLTQASPAADYSLLLFVREGNYWQVPVESRVKFEYNFALGVDGGEI